MAARARVLYPQVETPAVGSGEETPKLRNEPGSRREATLLVNGCAFIATIIPPRSNRDGDAPPWRTPTDRLEFEAEPRNEGYHVVNSSLKPDMMDSNHSHGFDARIFGLGGEITITRDNTPETFRAGQSRAVPAGCMHATKAGPEGVAYVTAKAYRRASVN